MLKRNILPAAVVISVVAATLIRFQETPGTTDPTSPSAHPDSSMGITVLPADPARGGWGTSPFSEHLPTTESPAERVTARRAKMAYLQYGTPPEYDMMGLKQLTDLAAKGDVLAMVQLGERYSSELDAIADDPAFDTTMSPDRLAVKYFTDAIVGGYTHVAAVMSLGFFQKRELADAYAWHLLSEKFNDLSNVRLYQKQAIFSGLSPNERETATKKYEELLKRLHLVEEVQVK